MFQEELLVEVENITAEMEKEMARQAVLELRKERKEECHRIREEKLERAHGISEENIDLIKKGFDK